MLLNSIRKLSIEFFKSVYLRRLFPDEEKKVAFNKRKGAFIFIGNKTKGAKS